MEKVLVPTNFMSWPQIADLLPDQKLIARELWANPFTKMEGFYQLPLYPFSSLLSIAPAAVNEALRELERRKVIVWDETTGEIYNLDWLRFHSFKGWALENYFKSLEKIQSPKIKSVVLQKNTAAGLKLPTKEPTPEKATGYPPVPVPPPPPVSVPVPEPPPPVPFSVPEPPPQGVVGGGVRDSKSKALEAFLQAAGDPDVLANEPKKLKKALGAATEEQARLAGLAWLNTKEMESPVGLAVILCRAAAAKDVTPCKAAVEEVVSAGKVAAAAGYARLRALHGNTFRTSAGKIARVEGESICFDDGATAPGREALLCLKYIEDGVWPSIP